MDKNNLPGLSPLWLMSLALVLGVFLATALPLIVLTKGVATSDWLGFSGGIIGAACTIFAGWLAYSAVQVQIRDYREAARRNTFEALDRKCIDIAEDVDRLMLASGYVKAFTGIFPNSLGGSNASGFALALFHARTKALDFISFSATGAPFGMGERISTAMSRIQTIGDRIAVASGPNLPSGGVISFYDPIVMNAIDGLRLISDQLDREIVQRQGEMVRIADERDRFA
jgi:hypothetical protein